jgi:hypothetical protein
MKPWNGLSSIKVTWPGPWVPIPEPYLAGSESKPGPDPTLESDSWSFFRSWTG